MTIRRLALLAVAGTLAVPAAAGAHAVVSPFQPQGKALTSARTLYVLRVPNERSAQPTYKVVLYVPEPIQQAIRLKKKPGWKIRVTKRDTGVAGPEGDKVYAIQKVVWRAKKGAAIDPLFFDDFFFRMQNPATPQRMCFWVHQYYRGERTGRKGRRGPDEIVKWTGPEGSETPASCVTFTES